MQKFFACVLRAKTFTAGCSFCVYACMHACMQQCCLDGIFIGCFHYLRMQSRESVWSFRCMQRKAEEHFERLKQEVGVSPLACLLLSVSFCLPLSAPASFCRICWLFRVLPPLALFLPLPKFYQQNKIKTKNKHSAIPIPVHENPCRPSWANPGPPRAAGS